MLTIRIVYDDDTKTIPRSTTVIAKRLPAAKAGRGGAARYVSGKMPVNAKNSHRLETSSVKADGKSQQHSKSTTVSNISELKTEDERIAAMFKLGADHWEQQQQEMAKYVIHLFNALLVPMVDILSDQDFDDSDSPK